MLAARKASRITQQEAKRSLRENAALVLPHVGLVIMTVSYIVAGALVFYFIEGPNEERIKTEKLLQIRALEQDYLAQLRNLPDDLSKEEWKAEAKRRLQNLSIATMEAYQNDAMTAQEVVKNKTIAKWTLTSSVFFASVVMTTVGYGNNVPRTYVGKIFCLFYALFGIPLALVTIADLSKFLALFIGRASKWIRRTARTKLSRFGLSRARNFQLRLSEKFSSIRTRKTDGEGAEGTSDQLDIRAPALPVPPIVVLMVLAAYTGVGAFVYTHTEDWRYGPAYYFCFITMTTIGFGDLVPEDSKFFYMLLNLAYIVLGLVLMTMSVDIVGSHYIREIHYVGRKINSMKELISLLGGKAASVSDVMANMRVLQRQYGITDSQIASLLNHPEFRDFIARPRDAATSLSTPESKRGAHSSRAYVPWNFERMKYIDTSRRSETSSTDTVDGASARRPVTFETTDLDSDMRISLESSRMI